MGNTTVEVLRMRKFMRLFCIGGGAYTLLEVIWRGRSHWSMFFVGGTCFHLIGIIGTRMSRRGLLAVAAACSAAVTVVEYLSGCLVNRRLKLNVWDYSRMPANLHGQVCLPYSLLWGGLSVLVLPLYRRLNQKSKVT